MKTIHMGCYCTIIMLLLAIISWVAAYVDGDDCNVKQSAGTCKRASDCPLLQQAIATGKLNTGDFVSCSLSLAGEPLICCLNTDIFQLNATAVKSDRPAVKACNQIKAHQIPKLTSLLLDRSLVEQGEFPHMAAIGFLPYDAAATDRNYTFLCGGTLIAKRFVLTAAHCTMARDWRPAVVSLGVTDVKDVHHFGEDFGVEAKVLKVHIHPNYTRSQIYDDIALLELQNDVRYSRSVYPACLHTDLSDPADSEKLWVTGWSADILTRRPTDRLSRAQFKMIPMDECAEYYKRFGATRKLHRGIISSQLCAYEPDNKSEACQGASGGPLHLVADDESTPSNRVVGVLSSGLQCGHSAPTLFMRVAAYLDFIENIVWPTE